MADALINYDEIAATALELITGFGTSIVVSKLNVTPADVTKPWRGATDPRAPYADSQTVPAVNVPQRKVNIGKQISKKDIPDNAVDFWIVAAPAGVPDLSGYDELTYNGTTSRFMTLDVLKPADLILLYVMVTLK